MEKSIFVNDLRKKCCIRWRLFQDHLQNYNREIQLAVSLMVSKVSKAWKLERKLRFRIWMSAILLILEVRAKNNQILENSAPLEIYLGGQRLYLNV